MNLNNSPIHPLRQPLFRSLWIASIASNIGTWMQNVGGAWLMTSLTPSPLMVALMQTATSLPVFLVGLPAGALADIVDRRRLLLFWQTWMLVAAALLGILTLFGATTPGILLGLTFALGLGSAMNAPAWQAIVPELVSRAQLTTAVTLNSAGFNVARAVGPALGGIIVAAASPAAVFLLNAASFLGVIAVIYFWQRQPRKSALPAERIVGAIRAGLRYMHHEPALRAVLVRTAVFIFSASGLWALLPLVAKKELKLGSFGYGVLLGCLGIGAVIGAFLLPKVRRKLSTHNLIIAATIIFALATLALAYVRNLGLVGAALMMGGLAWTTTMSSLNASTQLAVAPWVQARSLGFYQLVFQGGLASGSVVWGIIAERWGNSVALSGAALGLIVGLLAAIRYRLIAGEKLDLSPSLHWGEPIVLIDVQLEHGPVLITIEYRIDPEKGQDFTDAIHALSHVRLRDGAIRWSIWRDTADPGRYVETYVLESWGEHLRQHQRFTVSDRVCENKVRSFHIGEKPPIVSHLIYAQHREGVS